MTPSIIAIMMSTVTLGPADNPLADAQVTFHNTESNGPADVRDYQMEWQGIAITVTFGFNVDPLGSDSITVTPPLGWTCDPVDCTLTLLEDYENVIHLYAWKGM